MASSSERKRALVGWFVNNTGFHSDVQLQKFLFFYECFSKINGDACDFEGLKGYKNGPVFDSVLSDAKREQNFKNACREKFLHLSSMVDARRAKLSAFLVMTLGSKLSDFTHFLNIWAAKRNEIENGARYLPLNEIDFNEHDEAIFRDIEFAYPESYIDSVDVRAINGKAFVTFKSDANRLTDEILDALAEVSYDPSFDTPVHVSFSESGGLLLD